MTTNTTQSGNLKVPKLRFPGFEGGWEEKKLKDLFTKKTQKNTNGEEKFVLTNSAVQGIVGQLDYFEKDIANQNNLLGYYIVDVDDFIYNPRISKHAPVGPLKRNNYRKGVMSPLYTVLKPKIYFVHYLEKYFNTTKWYKYMFKIANYGARHDRMNIAQDDFLRMPIPFPSLPEQQKIADFLGAVDAMITNLKKQKELLEKYKKGMMQKIFSREIRFPGFSGEWEEKKLGEVLKIGNGKDYKHLDSGDIPVFGTGGYMLSVNKALYSGESVLIGRKGTIDKPFYFNGDFWTVDTLFYTHSFNNVIPKFINLVFQQINWKKHNEASGVPSLSKTTIEKIKISVPSLPEQQKIASFLSSIDDLIEAKSREIEKVERWKKGVMQRLFV